MEVVEDFDSGPHKAMSFVIERYKERTAVAADCREKRKKKMNKV